MSNNMNNKLFKWNNLENEEKINKNSSEYWKKNEKKIKKNSSEYWKKQTEKAAEGAVRRVTDIGSDIKLLTPLEDGVLEEAQQVVKGWLTNQKVYGTYYDRDSFMRLSCEETICQPSAVEIHKEWEHLVSKLESQQVYKEEVEALTDLANSDHTDDKRLKTIMHNLRNKSFVKTSQLRRIDSPKQVDVGKRMESRQEQVKKNREERLRCEEESRLKKISEKEACAEAMKMLKEEKVQKQLSKKKEEELIQMEMHRIRAEIQSQRDAENREIERARDAERVLTKWENQTVSVLEKSHKGKENQSKVNEDTNQRFKIISEIVERKFLNKKSRMLRRCFQVWRDEVEKRRVEMTQAAVWSNWQIVRKVFRVWRRDSRLTAINRRIEHDQQRMRRVQRKEEMALNFWKRTILKKCLLNWSLFVVDEKETRWFLKLEEMRKQKMAMYIDVLQEKAKENHKKLSLLYLENKNSDIKEVAESENQITSVESDRENPTSSRAPSSLRSHSSTRSKTKPTKLPKEAWQVTKKHAQLPLEQFLDDSDKLLQDSINCKALRPPKIVDTYANRNIAQKEIIEHQRSKLQEQERLINELVNVKISQKCSRVDLQDNNIRLLTPDVTENGIIEENNAEIKPMIPKKTNKFVIQMEERAKERQRIKNERLEKQKRQDEEKRRILAEQLTEQCRLEIEEKHKKEQLLREKREKEKILEEAKRRNMQIEQAKNKKADDFYKSILLKHYGLSRWKSLLERKRQYSKLALDHYKKRILRTVISAWFQDVDHHKKDQNQLITLFYNKVLLRRCFLRFRLYKEITLKLEQSAQEHYIGTLVKKTFSSWRLYNHRSQIRLDKLQILSIELYERKLLKVSFNIWRELPAASRMERERERRKETMRKKVASIIPDFKSITLEKL